MNHFYQDEKLGQVEYTDRRDQLRCIKCVPADITIVQPDNLDKTTMKVLQADIARDINKTMGYES